MAWAGLVWSPKRPLALSFPPLLPTGLRLPTSSADTRFDDDDDGEGWGRMEDKQCCPCQSPVGQTHWGVETLSFQKQFENFLRNAITIPRCMSEHGAAGE